MLKSYTVPKSVMKERRKRVKKGVKTLKLERRLSKLRERSTKGGKPLRPADRPIK